jgi:hypothetical protein
MQNRSFYLGYHLTMVIAKRQRKHLSEVGAAKEFKITRGPRTPFRVSNRDGRSYIPAN